MFEVITMRIKHKKMEEMQKKYEKYGFKKNKRYKKTVIG